MKKLLQEMILKAMGRLQKEGAVKDGKITEAYQNYQHLVKMYFQEES
jgi:hypothetical protein